MGEKRKRGDTGKYENMVAAEEKWLKNKQQSNKTKPTVQKFSL